MNKLEEMRNRLGLSRQDMADIMAVYITAWEDGASPEADKIPAVLNKYEKEILRQQEVIGRLQTKIRNYRKGIKSLQRAHEASLHRENALADTINQLREQSSDPMYGLCSPVFYEPPVGARVEISDAGAVSISYPNGVQLVEADRPE